MRVTVLYEEHPPVLLDMRKGQSFEEFHSWVTSRFQVPPRDALAFFQPREGASESDGDGDDETAAVAGAVIEGEVEVIPSFSLLRAHKQQYRVIRVVNISSEQRTAVFRPSLAIRTNFWELKYWYPLLALVLLCVMLGEGAVATLQGLVRGYLELWRRWAGEALPEKVAVDALTTLLAYPVTTFFIRRALNPDTGVLFVFCITNMNAVMLRCVYACRRTGGQLPQIRE